MTLFSQIFEDHFSFFPRPFKKSTKLDFFLQLATTTTQMSTLQDSFSAGNAGGADASLNLSKSFSEEEAKSMDQLMEIIKFLRHEKGILTSKVEVSKAEAVRLKAQVESIQHQLNETQNALNVAMEKSQSEMLPSSKYSQLLEKVQTIPALSDSNRYFSNVQFSSIFELTIFRFF